MCTCDRCKEEAKIFQMSRFNTDNCCMECLEKEKRHPMYAKAVAAERAAVLAGNYNFEGIGLPDDLRPQFEKERDYENRD